MKLLINIVATIYAVAALSLGYSSPNNAIVVPDSYIPDPISSELSGSLTNRESNFVFAKSQSKQETLLHLNNSNNSPDFKLLSGNESAVDESNVIIDSGSGNQYFNLSGSANTNFDGFNFGSFECTDTFILNGAQQKTHKCGDHNISYSELNYSIESTGTSHSSFSFEEIFFNTDLTSSNYCNGTSVDQNWQTSGAGINILNGLGPGIYELQVYTRTEHENSSGSISPDLFISNFGNNFTATFTVVDNTLPTASNPAAVNVQCASDIPAVDTDVVSDEADNCSGAITVAHVSDVSDGNSNPEVITRTYSVTDLAGNSINVTQTITVDDTTNPS
uniref:HYR-like domain-containing protein n=1 Tax=Winogradskyella aurantiaca TaxID=2219558 RepID=UPI001300B23C